nr:hypothetical protein [Cupriavidus basilensis]
MSSRATPPAEPSAATVGGTPALDGTAGAGSPPSQLGDRRALAFARAFGRALLAGLRHPVWRGLARVLVRLALALALLALLAGLLIRFVLWPQASAARTWLEQRGSVALAAHLSIGQLDTYWDGWHPAFHARDVKAVDADQRVLLAAGELDGKLSWRSLFSMDVLFQRISARQTDLLIRRSADGKLKVAGLAVDTTGAQPQDNRLFDWLLAQGRVELTDGKLRWLDDKNKLPQLDVGDSAMNTCIAPATGTTGMDRPAGTLAGWSSRCCSAISRSSTGSRAAPSAPTAPSSFAAARSPAARPGCARTAWT